MLILKKIVASVVLYCSALKHVDALHYHQNVRLNPKILGFKIGHVKYSFFLSFRFRAQHVFMRFTALVIRINVFRPRTAFTDVFCRFRLVFFCFCASHEDENDAGGRYCHNLRWYDDRIALSFSVAIEFSIHADAGVAPLGLWMHLMSRFGLLHLFEEWCYCVIRGCNTLLRVLYGAQGPQLICTPKTLIPPPKNNMFMHSCKGYIANMKCNMFLYVDGRCYVNVFKPKGWIC